jgi:hypothetical protein
VGLPFFGLAPEMGAFEFGMAGDFNNDGAVDAADYTVWRDHLGDVFTAADYQTWRTFFGATTSGGGALAGAPVPESATWALILGLVSGIPMRQWQFSRFSS